MIDEENQVGSTPETTENLTEPPVEPSHAVEATSGDASGAEAYGAGGALGEEVPLADAVLEDPAGSSASPAAVAELENEVKALKAQIEERNSQFARMAADFDNYRKRTQREREEFEQKVKCDVIVEMLPVVDNFERARSQIKPQTDAETTIHKSYQSVYKQLVECLKRVGVAPMRAEGKEFDPAMHEAVMRQSTNEFPEGTVMEELQRGYMLGDRVLRHALVKVAAAPDPTESVEESPSAGQDE